MNEGILTAVYSRLPAFVSTVSIAKLLSPEDKVLIIDDFLANGQAAKGLIRKSNKQEQKLKRWYRDWKIFQGGEVFAWKARISRPITA